MVVNKKQLGQFFTTNYKYILQSFQIPNNVSRVVEPFAGNKDLIKFLDESYSERPFVVECFDIDPKSDDITKQDTLNNPPDLTDAFVLTNPPYLARNKSKDKDVYEKYKTNDLYKCFIEILIQSKCIGGILIIPLNFISSIRKSDIELRRRFITKYHISHVNIFEEQVFDDTSYTVCSLQFERKIMESHTNCTIYPSKTQIQFTLNTENNYTIGGNIYNLYVSGTIDVDRATRLTNNDNITNILLKCLDDNSQNMIRLMMVDDATRDKYIDNTENLTARSYATLIIKPSISKEEQESLVFKFNEYLKNERESFHSLFLSNYRESKGIARKRISFKLAFDLCNYLLSSA